jgi:hypothetical protein
VAQPFKHGARAVALIGIKGPRNDFGCWDLHTAARRLSSPARRISSPPLQWIGEG